MLVVMPVHRGLGLVDDAIASLERQAYENWRLVVVDDACPDATGARVRRTWRDSRIDVLHLPSNLGQGRARMRGIERFPSPPLLAFLDQDDLWHENKLLLQVRALLADEGAAAVICDTELCSRELVPVPGAEAENAYRSQLALGQLDAGSQLRALYRRNFARLGSAVVRREAFTEVGGFPTGYAAGEDYCFWIRLCGTGHRVIHVAEPLYIRRLHGRNESEVHRAQRLQGLALAFGASLEELEETSPVARARLRELLWRAAVRALRDGDADAARSLARRFLREAEGRERVQGALLFGIGLSGRVGRAALRARHPRHTAFLRDQP